MEKGMTERILDGFGNHEFKMHLQFIVDCKTKKIVSAEALSRWECPSNGTMSPVHYYWSHGTGGTYQHA